MRVRIWLEDSVEPEGGFWSYGIVDKNGFLREDGFNYTNKEDQLILFQEFINDNYIIEILNESNN
jgi:hypothetical protein